MIIGVDFLIFFRYITSNRSLAPSSEEVKGVGICVGEGNLVSCATCTYPDAVHDTRLYLNFWRWRWILPIQLFSKHLQSVLLHSRMGAHPARVVD